MNISDFETECKVANEKLENFSFTGDAKEDLRCINNGIRIMRVTRLVKRTRMFIGAALAVVGGGALIAGGIIADGLVMTIAFIIIGALLCMAGVWYFIANLNAVTHKAVCVIENGKVREYIYSRGGAFICNTIEGEIGLEKGKVYEKKHSWTKYSPVYPYADFLDRDYSAYLKSRGGIYEGGETYVERADSDEISAYYDTECKKHKFTLKMQDNKPYKMDYLNSESFIYSRINETDLTLVVPTALKGKIKIPSYMKVEYIDFSKDYKKIWERV